MNDEETAILAHLKHHEEITLHQAHGVLPAARASMAGFILRKMWDDGLLDLASHAKPAVYRLRPNPHKRRPKGEIHRV